MSVFEVLRTCLALCASKLSLVCGILTADDPDLRMDLCPERRAEILSQIWVIGL